MPSEIPIIYFCNSFIEPTTSVPSYTATWPHPLLLLIVERRYTLEVEPSYCLSQYLHIPVIQVARFSISLIFHRSAKSLLQKLKAYPVQFAMRKQGKGIGIRPLSQEIHAPTGRE